VQPLPAERLQKQEGEARNDALGREALVWVLSALCQYFRIPFDEGLVTGQLAPPYEFETVAHAARLLGLRAGWKALPAARLKKLAAPFVVALGPVGSGPPRQSRVVDRENPSSLYPGASAQRLAFVLHLEEDRVAFGRVLQAVPKNKSLVDPGAKFAASAHFGFRCFVPELPKHRKLFHGVLMGHPSRRHRSACRCPYLRRGQCAAILGSL
jgi:hypothetical protein